MPYEAPLPVFDPVAHATEKVVRANSFEVLVLGQFREMYHEFWGVSDPPTGSRYSVEEMQSVLNKMPQATALEMMMAAAQFYVFVSQAYPGAMPVQYGTAAFDYTFDGQSLTLTGLKAIWETPEEP